MEFLAIVQYGHGGRITHEFRCPLERAAFLAQLAEQDPEAEVLHQDRTEPEDHPPIDEAHWYDPHADVT